MKVAPNTQIAGRYELVDRLGAGAMGEVWRARDTRFESRLVAVKLLREDDTLKEDAANRDRMVIQLEQQASRGGISASFAVEAIASALAASNIEGLKARAASVFAGAEAIPPTAVTALFDEVVNDPAFNDNAKLRAKMRRLFRDEANTVANLRHDNVVSIFDYGDHQGNPFLVMDYIEGRTLYQILQAEQDLGQSRSLALMEDLCAGLGYAHRHKLVHRDIKPANLIIASTTGSLKILDFGVVRRLGSKSTIGMPIGTFCYMSPEQTRGEAALDHRSDIFAVGVVFYELMSGRKAFPPSKSIPDLIARIQRDSPRPLSELVPSISPAIEDIIGKAIEKRPEDRYQDLAIMGRAIARIRAPLEAAEHAERTMIAGRANPTQIPVKPPVLAAKPPEPGVAELLASAERSFASGDDQAAVDFCSRILSQKAGFPPALSLLARAEARRWESRLREVLHQAEKEMAVNDLTAARGTLGRAREIDPSSPLIRAVEAKLNALERAERARMEQLKTPPAAPAPPPAIDLDDDAVTRPFAHAPLGRPPVLGAPKAPPSPPPAPPTPSMPVAPAPPGAVKPPSSARRRRIARTDADDTSGPRPAPVVPPAEPPRAVSSAPAGPAPAAAGPPADPAGEALLPGMTGAPVRPSAGGRPVVATEASRDRAPDRDAATKRLDPRSIQRALSEEPRRPPSAVRPARPRAWTLLSFAAGAALLALALYAAVLRRPTAPADSPSPQVAAADAPVAAAPSASAAPTAASPGAAPTAAPSARADAEVKRVMDAYVAALSARDVGEVAKVRDLNAATRAGLEKVFGGMRSQQVSIVGDPRITFDGGRAQVEATLHYDVEQSSGERRQNDVSATVILNRVRNQWRIVRVSQ